MFGEFSGGDVDVVGCVAGGVCSSAVGEVCLVVVFGLWSGDVGVWFGVGGGFVGGVFVVAWCGCVVYVAVVGLAFGFFFAWVIGFAGVGVDGVLE